MSIIAPVRPSSIAGTWYERNPTALARNIDQYLDQADLPDLPGETIALIAPHAGHKYSGAVAGYAFATVRGRHYDLVVILSPMHQPYPDHLLTTAHSAYGTPLGDIVVDRQSVTDLDIRLRKSLGTGLTPVAYDREHSLEIELPFLQRTLDGDFKLLPVMVRSQSVNISEALGLALAETLQGKNALIIASTDLSHFSPQKEALAFDSEMLRRIESCCPQAGFKAEVGGTGFASGLGALSAVFWAAKALGANKVKVLCQATSGDVTGDYSSVVGYGAAVVIKTN
jgi:AmmeMemoRadiSam system protein B